MRRYRTRRRDSGKQGLPGLRPFHRREFIKATGGVVAAAALGACEAVPLAVGETGTLEVRVSGLATSAAGTVTVSRPDGTDPGVTVALPDADAQGVSLGVATGVPVGTYRIAYTPPGSHLLTDASNAKDLTVSANSAARADFTVQAVGTLEVRVSGFAAGASSAGSVAVTRPDGSPSGVSVSLPTPSNGSSLGTAPNTAVGAYRVTYAPPSGYTRTDPSASKDVTIVVGQSARAEFGVAELSGGPAVVFASDFGTATGEGATAVNDGGKWSTPNLNGSLEVVAASAYTLLNGGKTLAAAGWPSTNALKKIYKDPAVSSAPGVSNVWAEPAVGQYLYYRCYFCHDGNDALGGGSTGGSHSPQSGVGACTAVWSWSPSARGNSAVASNRRPFEPNTIVGDGTYFLIFANSISFNGSSGLSRPWCPPLNKGAVYRIEWRIFRNATSSFWLSVRVYDSSGTLLYSDSDFRVFGVNSLHSGFTLADNKDFGYESTHQTNQCFRDLLIGVGGNTGRVAGEVHIEGCFAVSGPNNNPNGWIGPYVPGEGP